MSKNVRQSDGHKRGGKRSPRITRSQLSALNIDTAQINAARQRLAGMTLENKLRMVLKFAQNDLPKDPKERLQLGYDLRAFVEGVAQHGWSMQRRLGALSDRDLTKIHNAVKKGWAALKATRTATPMISVFTNERTGWRLPAYRVRLIHTPAPPDTKTAVIATYRASDEPSRIVVLLGQFLLQHSARWRPCRCGCGESLVPNGKQQFLPKHSNRFRQRRFYEKHRRTRRRARRVHLER